MSKQFDTLIFIGRFQPVHYGHEEIIRTAATLARQVIILVGSSFQPRTFKNPWTFQDRMLMLQNVCEEYRDLTSIRIQPLRDYMYDDVAWATNVQLVVSKFPLGEKVGIIGHKKDESSFYLDMFPQWKLVEVNMKYDIHATDIREEFFSFTTSKWCKMVPSSVETFLHGFSESKEYEQIYQERRFIEEYKQQFSGLQYDPTFVTADAVVVQSGHILLIRRRSEPGKGLWALPGGFLSAKTDRSVVDAALRELKEETGIKVPVPVLRGNIRQREVFDAINRSARGRTITHAVYIILPDGELPKVKGQDDAEKAKWVPISEVNSEEMFEDHFDIIMSFVGAV